MDKPIFLIAFSFFVPEGVLAYPFGAPACVAKPRHGFESQPLGTLPVEISKTEIQAGDYEVRITGEGCFKGILIMTQNSGEFKTSEDLVSLPCDGSLGSKGYRLSNSLSHYQSHCSITIAKAIV